jgi:hypothetical protein
MRLFWRVQNEALNRAFIVRLVPDERSGCESHPCHRHHLEKRSFDSLQHRSPS